MNPENRMNAHILRRDAATGARPETTRGIWLAARTVIQLWDEDRAPMPTGRSDNQEIGI